MKKLLIILSIIFLPYINFGQRLEISNYVLTDSDNILNIKNGIGYYHKMNRNWLIGSNIGHYYYKDIDNMNFNYISINNYIKRDSIYNIDLNLDYQFNKNYDLFKYDVLGGFHPNKYMYVELYSNRDWIETTDCIRKDIIFYNNGISTDFYFKKYRLTFVGAYTNQYFNDKNSKGVKIFKVIGHPIENMGIFISSKLIDSDFKSQDYFSPLNFDTYAFGVYHSFTLNKESFILKPQFTYGSQNIDSEIKSYYAFDILFKGWYKDKYGIDFKFGISNSVNEFGQYNLINGNLKLKYQLN